MNVKWPRTPVGELNSSPCLPGYSVFDEDNRPQPQIRPQRLCLRNELDSSAFWQVPSFLCEGFSSFSSNNPRCND